MLDTDQLFTANPVRKPGFRFLDLPPELRDAVYGMILPNEIHINSASDIQDLALLCSSRQLRQESRSIFYRTCMFGVELKRNTLFNASEHWHRFQRWIEGLQENDVSSIRHLRFDVSIVIPQTRRYGDVRTARYDISSLAGASTYTADCEPREPELTQLKIDANVWSDEVAPGMLRKSVNTVVKRTLTERLRAYDVAEWGHKIISCPDVKFFSECIRE